MPTPRSPSPRLPARAPSFWAGRARSFRWAFAGLGWLLRSQPNARLHLAATVLVAAAGVTGRLAAGEWAAVLTVTALVWTAEAFNTALEALADEVTRDWRPGLGRAKDAAAAAVLLSSGGAVGVGLCVFGPRLWRLCFPG